MGRKEQAASSRTKLVAGLAKKTSAAESLDELRPER